MGLIPEKSSLSKFNHAEFLCGWGAGIVETTILFPTSKLVFRQQLLGLAAKEAAAQLRSEGIMYLYRGLLPPLIMRTVNRSIMFGMYDKYKKLLGCPSSPHFNSTITPQHAFAAFLAGMTEATLCPLERIQVLLQNSTYHQNFRNTHEAFYAIAKHGPTEFYRGYTMIVFRNGMSNILFFTLREPLREHIIFKTGQQGTNASQAPFLHFASNFVSGAILGASISTLFFPVNVVKHRIQSTLDKSSKNTFNYDLFRSMEYVLRDTRFENVVEMENALTNFFNSKTVDFYARGVDLLPVKWQEVIDPEGTPFQSPLAVFQIVWQERNRSIKELYRGVQVNFTRSLLAWGITNSVYEIMLNLLK